MDKKKNTQNGYLRLTTIVSVLLVAISLSLGVLTDYSKISRILLIVAMIIVITRTFLFSKPKDKSSKKVN